MLRFIEENLLAFRSCFSRSSTHKWFMVIVISLMIRVDSLGVTSFIRALSLNPTRYETMLHFFRSTAFKTNDLRKKWWKVISGSAPFIRMNGRILLLGDGTKVCKEARFMPAVKKLYQESENSAKPQYIYGHMFGGIGAVVGNDDNAFCLPLDLSIQDGLRATASWDNANADSAESHVVQMVRRCREITKVLGSAYFVLDRYFLTVPAIRELSAQNTDSSIRIDIITRAKNNCIAFEKPIPSFMPRRGRPRKRGNSVKLAELFEKEELFKEADVTMYGKSQQVQYYCVNLLWGLKLYQELRFVLVKYGDSRAIFVSTDLSLDPTLIMEAYAHRFKIECTFRELKQQVCAFGYHFWTSHAPKMNKYKKRSDPDPLETIDDKKSRTAILSTIDACERFVLCSEVAIGIVQLIALRPVFVRRIQKHRYLRTSNDNKISEATVFWYLRKNIFRLLSLNAHSSISRIILEMQEPDLSDENAA